MTTKQEIEDYISDWHFDEETKTFAFDIGKFLWAFMAYLNSTGLAEKTKKEHFLNLRVIGDFECGYGYSDEFDVSLLEDGPNYEYEFEHKVSSSKFAMKSYSATWNKLDKFIKSGEFEEWLQKVEDEIMEE